SSAANQSRNLAMRQNLHSLAAEDDSGHALAAVRGHENKVATLVLRGVDDCLVGMIVHDVHALIRNAGGLGSIFRHAEVLFGSGLAVSLVLLRGVSDHHRVN